MTVAKLIQKLQALPAPYHELEVVLDTGGEGTYDINEVNVELPHDAFPEDNVRVVLT